ncbi:hypothetical protein CMALT430_230046 [Carnobacterium maltaromaticum]|nr:hypothetical protein CMALT430_230046 [Carnobacterium maltaromaticum]
MNEFLFLFNKVLPNNCECYSLSLAHEIMKDNKNKLMTVPSRTTIGN